MRLLHACSCSRLGIHAASCTICDHGRRMALSTNTRRCCASPLHDDARLTSRLLDRLRVVRDGKWVHSCAMVDGCQSKLDDRSIFVTVDDVGQSSWVYQTMMVIMCNGIHPTHPQHTTDDTSISCNVIFDCCMSCIRLVATGWWGAMSTPWQTTVLACVR